MNPKDRAGHVALRGQNPQFGVNDLSGIIRRHEDSITIENLSLRTEETSLRVAGSIRGIDPKIDPASRLVSIRGEVANPEGKLTPGQFVQIRVELPER